MIPKGFTLLSLLAAVFGVSFGQGPSLGSCHCTEGPLFGDECVNGRCNVTMSPYFGCRISAEYFYRQGSEGLLRVTYACVRDDLDWRVNCGAGVPGDVFIEVLNAGRGDVEICCVNRSDCNSPELYERLTATEAPSSTEEPPPPAYAIAIITLLSIVVVLILSVIAIVLCVHYVVCPLRSRSSMYGTPTVTMTLDSGSYGDPSLNELLDDSGSGSGLPLLLQRSIAGQVSLQELIGKGRFGEVWKGSLKGDEVAVKIFHPREEVSWFHEVELYQTCLLRHPSILRFIAADNKDTGIQTQLWLITEFCEYGSLYDLLIQRSFNEELMVRLCYTAACGLDHLHTEVVGTERTQSKPAIAHRDLKSRNILVKGDFTCCIADLGLSLTYNMVGDGVEDPPSKRVGTKRYLAPEIIDETICFKNLTSYKMADVYSFGLVLWEIARRGECGGHAEEAELPYYEVLPVDPSFDDMKKVVVLDKRRPGIPNRWSASETHRTLCRIIEQCWHDSCEARLTALRVKKSLGTLSKSEKGKKSEQS